MSNIDTKGLRKLALLLAPLTDLADSLDKIDSADNHLAEVTAAREKVSAELEAAKAAAADVRAKTRADQDAIMATINEFRVKTEREMKELVAGAKNEAEAIIGDAKAEAKKIRAAADKRADEHEARVKAAELALSDVLSQTVAAEKKLTDIKAAIAKIAGG